MLILVASETHDKSEEVNNIKLREDNPPSSKEMEIFFKAKNVTKNGEMHPIIITWLDCYNHYIKYKQHKNLTFLQGLNAHDNQLKHSFSFVPDSLLR